MMQLSGRVAAQKMPRRVMRSSTCSILRHPRHLLVGQDAGRVAVLVGRVVVAAELHCDAPLAAHPAAGRRVGAVDEGTLVAELGHAAHEGEQLLLEGEQLRCSASPCNTLSFRPLTLSTIENDSGRGGRGGGAASSDTSYSSSSDARRSAVAARSTSAADGGGGAAAAPAPDPPPPAAA